MTNNIHATWQNILLSLQRFVDGVAARCKSAPSRLLYVSIWDWQLSTFCHSVSEDNYETKIIRAGPNKRRKRVLCLDLFEPFCNIYKEKMTDTCILGIAVPTLRNMNPFQPPFGRGFPEQHKGLSAAEHEKGAGDRPDSLPFALYHGLKLWGSSINTSKQQFGNVWRMSRRTLPFLYGLLYVLLIMLCLCVHLANTIFVCMGFTR